MFVEFCVSILWPCSLIPLHSPLSLHTLKTMTFFSHVFTPLPLFLWKSNGFYLTYWPSSHSPFQLLLLSKKHFLTTPLLVSYPSYLFPLPEYLSHTVYNCQFIYLYFLLDYTHHEGSGCVNLIHCVFSAIAQCLAQKGIRLMNAWISKKTELCKYIDCWKTV